jgi:hypothetical protein
VKVIDTEQLHRNDGITLPRGSVAAYSLRGPRSSLSRIDSPIMLVGLQRMAVIAASKRLHAEQRQDNQPYDCRWPGTHGTHGIALADLAPVCSVATPHDALVKGMLQLHVPTVRGDRIRP